MQHSDWTQLAAAHSVVVVLFLVYPEGQVKLEHVGLAASRSQRESEKRALQKACKPESEPEPGHALRLTS